MVSCSWIRLRSIISDTISCLSSITSSKYVYRIAESCKTRWNFIQYVNRTQKSPHHLCRIYSSNQCCKSWSQFEQFHRSKCCTSVLNEEKLIHITLNRIDKINLIEGNKITSPASTTATAKTTSGGSSSTRSRG